jgi:hypothetical protein
MGRGIMPIIPFRDFHTTKIHKLKHTHFGYEQDVWDFQYFGDTFNIVNGNDASIIGGYTEIAGGKQIDLGQRFQRNTGYNVSAGAPFHLTAMVKYDNTVPPFFGLIVVIARGNLSEGIGIIYDSTPTTLPSAGLGVAAWNGTTWAAHTVYGPAHADLEKWHKWDFFYNESGTVSIWVDDAQRNWFDKSLDPFSGVSGVRFFVLGSSIGANDVAGRVRYASFGAG